MLKVRPYALVLAFIGLQSVFGGPVGAGGQLPPPTEGWLVLYDHLDSKMERALAGTLEIDGGFLRYRALNRQLTWDVGFDDIESIRIEEVVGPARRVRTLVIISQEGDSLVRRRIVPVDEELRFISPVVLSGTMKASWKRFSEQRATASAR